MSEAQLRHGPHSRLLMGLDLAPQRPLDWGLSSLLAVVGAFPQCCADGSLHRAAVSTTAGFLENQQVSNWEQNESQSLITLSEVAAHHVCCILLKEVKGWASSCGGLKGQSKGFRLNPNSDRRQLKGLSRKWHNYIFTFKMRPWLLWGDWEDHTTVWIPGGGGHWGSF